MKISEFARFGDVNVETIRYYQRLGLLRVPSNNSGYRQYTQSDLNALQFIKNAKAAGFTLEEIKHLNDLDAIRDKTSMRLLSEQKKQALAEKIKHLTDAMEFLDTLIQECKNSNDAVCPILKNLNASPNN